MTNESEGKMITGKSKLTCLGAVALAFAAQFAIMDTSIAQEGNPDGATRAPKGNIASVTAAPELVWQMPANVDKSYNSIDGQRMMTYVKEQAAISDKARDQGVKYWGRIAGQPSGDEMQAWVTQKLRDTGLQVETTVIPMTRQDIPKDWDISVSAGGRPLKLASAFPIIDFPAYMPGNKGEENLDAVWVSLGQPIDFAGKDVRGKAVFIYSIPTPSTLVQSADWIDAVGRAQKAGAKAAIVGIAIPGNMKYVSHLTGEPLLRDVKIPIFTIGNDDLMRVAEMANDAVATGRFKAHISWDVETRTGHTEGVVIGKLPGMTDEKIVMIAHTDGLFEGATDDGAGVAALIETASYFAKLPKEKRRRTMYFIGLPDHHEGNAAGAWLHDHMKSLFPNTAVIMNAEHIAAKAPVYDRPWGKHAAPSLISTNGLGPSWWGVYGSDRLATIVRDDYALFGVPTQIAEGGSPGELSAVQFDAPSFYLHNKGVYYHADADTPDIVPVDGMRNVVQAISKIFNDVNQADLKDLLAPPDRMAKTASSR
jgi:hypothetical protein